MRRQQSRARAALILILSFLLPALMLLLVYQRCGMAPAGEKSLLIMDMSDQYVEFYAGLRHLGQGGDILFSWSKAMGGNYVGVFAYYLSSPFSFLTLLFPAEALPHALMLVNLVKVGCAGLALSLWLAARRGAFRPHFVFFALMYALMSYAIVYSMCLMWLDGMIWLPIVLIGVRRVLRAERPALLASSLAAALLSNYYTGYMVFLFAFLYFLFESACVRRGARAFFRKLGLCALAAILAGGLSAWLLAPTLQSLLQGKVDGATNLLAQWQTLAQPQFLLTKLLLGSYDSITYDGLPSIYCGVASLLLCISFFFQRRIPLRTRLAALGFMALLLASFLLKPLDTIWHGGQPPNWFPFRYAFAFGFLMIDLAERAFVARERGRTLPGALICLLLLGAAHWLLREDESTLPALLVTAGFAGLYALLFIGFRRGRGALLLALLLTLLGCVEVHLNGTALVAGLDGQFGYKSLAAYQAYQARLQPLVNEANRLADGDFFRMEKEHSLERSKNDAIGFGYRGITHYSSSYDRGVNAFLSQLGFAQAWIWNSAYGTTPITDALFGIRFRMSETEVCPWYAAVAGHDGVVLYENPDALSIAYAAPREVLDAVPLSQDASLLNQDALLRAITGHAGSFLTPVSPITMTAHTAAMNYTFTTLAAGPVYAYFPWQAQPCALWIDGAFREWHFTDETHCVFYVGDYDAGEAVHIALFGADGTPSAGMLEVYTLEESTLRAQLTALAARQLTIKRHSAREIVGVIEADADCALITSIPYDAGWQIFIGGARVEARAFAGALLCAELPAGTHEIALRYAPVGFALGASITAATLAAIALLALRRALLRRRA